MKYSQADVRYRAGSPTRSCGLCGYYLGKKQCEAVTGEISAFGFCDIYQRQPNPFKGANAMQPVREV